MSRRARPRWRRVVLLAAAAALAVGCGDDGEPTDAGDLGDLPADIRPLVEEMRRGGPDVRKEAIDALAALGAKAHPALPYLRKVMSDEDPKVRIAATKAVAIIQDAHEKAEAAKPVNPDDLVGQYFADPIAAADLKGATWDRKNVPPDTGPKFGDWRDATNARLRMMKAKYEPQPRAEAVKFVRKRLENAVWTIDDERGVLVRLPKVAKGSAEKPVIDVPDTMRLFGRIELREGKAVFEIEPVVGGGVVIHGTLAPGEDGVDAEINLQVTTDLDKLSARFSQHLKPILRRK